MPASAAILVTGLSVAPLEISSALEMAMSSLLAPWRCDVAPTPGSNARPPSPRMAGPPFIAPCGAGRRVPARVPQW